MKKQLAKLLDFELGLDMFYVISVRKTYITLQGEYNKELIKQLEEDSRWIESPVDGYHNFEKDNFNIYLEENKK